MKDVISMSVGEPDFVTPWNVRQAAINSVERGLTHYTSNSGLPELRRLIREYLNDRYDVHYDMNDILVTVGASEALDLAFRALIDPGDEVLIPAPSYVSYEPGVKLAGGVSIPIVTEEKDDFVIKPENIEKVITEKTKLIIIPYPNNPTGAILDKEDIIRLQDLVLKHDLFVIADEIYSELTYSRMHQSFAEGFEDRTVLINGFSKAFAMTGWRLGYAAGPKEVIQAMLKIHQYTMLCAPISSQYAGVEALSSEMNRDYSQIREMVRSYNRRRVFLVDSFRSMGLPCYEPKGAFYVFPNISPTGLSSEDFCTKLLLEKKVACVPGTAFGESGEGFIRCSYATSMLNLEEAVKRIRDFIGGLN
ncbi:MAG: aminotransferase class I/II-fold pyridoxal phosphate-dependent enzyme [Clostridia bacterium]|nr:aminotransferase class I/II-fold pyridoxal phosphate-dependent enzyme [Clostridia bacterium]MBR3563819.1 aminotransferase class I/II-fold pyridoxal phosphate-dependent enzyme [Clostridia bacterium]